MSQVVVGETDVSREFFAIDWLGDDGDDGRLRLAMSWVVLRHYITT